MKFTESTRSQRDDSEFLFTIRAASALGISVIADGLDYLGAPIFALPVVGDIADLIVVALLYRITKSRVSIFINAIEFIPFIGDLIPTYTISTLMWILKESHKRKKQNHSPRNDMLTLHGEPSSTGIVRRNHAGASTSESEGLGTRIMRAYAILRSGT